MEELIKVSEKDGVATVNARDLYRFIESGQEFANWIKGRIDRYSFEEGEDFLTILSKSTGGRPSMEYYLTLDMAKELCMVENNDQGRRARRYFIEVEKRYKANASGIPDFSNPAEIARAWADEYERRQALEAQNKAMLPKVEFYDQVTGSKDTVDMKEVAKVLNIKGIGRNKLFAILRDKKVLDRKNQPYQEYVDRGYFRVVETEWEHNGSVHINLKTVVFQKGVDFIRRAVEK